MAAGAGILIPLTNDDFFPADGAARFCFRFERFPNDGSLRLVRRPCAINATAAPAIDADHAHACRRHEGPFGHLVQTRLHSLHPDGRPRVAALPITPPIPLLVIPKLTPHSQTP